MLCKKNGGYIAIIIGVLFALYGSHKTHTENSAELAPNIHSTSALTQTSTGK